MLRRARDLMYWPAMTQDIKQIADNCEACQRMKPQNQKETLKQHDDGQRCWSKIGTDLFEISGRQYLVTVDYFSNFIEVDYLPKTTADDVINKLLSHFARYGVPTEGSQFTSDVFQRWLKRWGVIHTTSSPTHHQANGKAEAAVKTAKHLMWKCIQSGSDVYEALLELRNTPAQDTNVSPTQLMFGHLTRSRIPAATEKQLGKKVVREAMQKRTRRRQSVKRCYDRQARDLPPLQSGQPVFFQHKEGQRWQRGTVQKRRDERSYIIHGENDGVYRRNRVHVRPTCPSPGVPEQDGVYRRNRVYVRPTRPPPGVPEQNTEQMRPPLDIDDARNPVVPSNIDSAPPVITLPSPRPKRATQKPS
ncbi:hypothetical protein V1264_011788 [Littorina saxatilis]|uniref:Integrase catalytic domain-containing protein n=1 Tax=Littorina saxatilis TaxID=31220 RepID=A0AAN9BVH4_9CAEN